MRRSAVILIALEQDFAVLISSNPVTRWRARKSSSVCVWFSNRYSNFGGRAAVGSGSGEAALSRV
jgi:hypothetical protein